jgi:hypothetical protein
MLAFGEPHLVIDLKVDGFCYPFTMEVESMSVQSRSAEKESFWRSHLERQSVSGESIRGYCRWRGLSEGSFHFWRREIANRDRDGTQTCGRGPAGLMAVKIVDEPSRSSMAAPTLEIECPGGTVIRVREEVSLDVLQRVLRACQQIQSEDASASVSVRSC